MIYEAIARKYRPKSFREVVGQDHIVDTIANAIAAGRIHHAYLFSGTRGVGKTTMARLLAKALNCAKGPTADICGDCHACTGISAGSFVDVQEIDGASNRGIDEIRNLRENVRFAPVSARYKVFIIDEAHQITGAAFNALLKTLEEPPKHAVFILATTESQNIPPTIASRCQKYRFRMIPEREISASLKKILAAEKIVCDEDAVSMIARAADGSMRDAQSLADQAIAFGDGAVTADKVKELLGALPSEIVDSALSAISSADAAAALKCAQAVSSEGYDFPLFFSEMLSALRALLFAKSGVTPDATEIERRTIAKYADVFSISQILRFSKMILKARDEMRWAGDARFVAELYLVKMTRPFVGADEIAAAAQTDSSGLSPRAEAPSPRLSPRVDAAEAGDPPPDTLSAAVSHADRQFPVSPAVSSDPCADLWKKLIVSLPSVEERLRVSLQNARLRSLDSTSAVIEAQSGFYLDSLRQKSAAISGYLEKLTGRKCGLKFSVASKPVSSPAPGVSRAPDDENADDIVEDAGALPPGDIPQDESIFSAPGAADGVSRPAKPFHYPEGIKKILDIFPGKVEKSANNE